MHIPLSQLREMPGASAIEQAWIGGDCGYLAGRDAEAAACDALTVPVVTGHADMTVIDEIIAIALAATGHGDDDDSDHDGKTRELTPAAAHALRYAIAWLAIDFVSGPDGIASALRTGLLEPPFSTPSLPLDIGYSDTIPGHIRRAVLLRDRSCAWPRCGQPAAWCDVHHRHHKKDGGETSVDKCVLLCQFHHDICIHRWGWQLIVHPDGTTTAHGPNGQVLHSHSPPTTRAA